MDYCYEDTLDDIDSGWYFEESLYDSLQDQVDQDYNGAPQVYEENK